jgi:hypothetical protein
MLWFMISIATVGLPIHDPFPQRQGEYLNLSPIQVVFDNTNALKADDVQPIGEWPLIDMEYLSGATASPATDIEGEPLGPPLENRPLRDALWPHTRELIDRATRALTDRLRC